MNKEALLESVKFDEKGLVPVIAQDYHSKKVRMLAYMNKESLIKTLETGKMYYYSRSRNKLWLKGETSSNYQYVKGISIDCDGDTLLVQIEQQNGISCHTGNATCFYQELEEGEVTKKLPSTNQVVDDEKTKNMLLHLFTVIEERKQNPKAGSYTNYLLDKGINKILKKVGEEATEVIIAAKEEDKGELTFEVADLLYHLTVLLAAKEMDWGQIAEELEKRH